MNLTVSLFFKILKEKLLRVFAFVKSKTYYILIGFFALLFVFAGVMLIREISISNGEKQDYEDLISEFEIAEEYEEYEQPENTESASSAAQAPKKKKSTYKKVDVNAAIKKNPDCYGWLTVWGTVINYPVMHTPEDEQKYLHLNFNGKQSRSGVPFMDARCFEDSDNIIIYGHNMLNGTMFHALKNYRNQGYWNKHKSITFETANEKISYKVCAVVKVKSTDNWYGFTIAGSEEYFNNRIKETFGKAYYYTGITPKYGQKLLTLSTCFDGNHGDDRLIVIAVRQD